MVTIAAVVTAAAVLPTAGSDPAYVGKSVLVLSSPGRGPEQDAMMVVGYAQIFNDPPTIERLRTTEGLPPDAVDFEARTVGASPMLEIAATASNPEDAQDAATLMAGAFRDDINHVRQQGAEDAASKLEDEYNTLLAKAPVSPDGSANPTLEVLRQRIEAIRADTTNQLLDLQPRAGVGVTATGLVPNLAMGVLGGLLLGLLAALAAAKLSSRIPDSETMKEKTGVEPLVEVPRGSPHTHDRLREDRLRILASHIHLQDLPKSTVIAVTDCAGAAGARPLATALARLSAQQGYGTVLVYTDNSTSELREIGFNDALTDSALVYDALVAGDAPSLKILPAGSMIFDRYSRMTREKIDAVFDELRTCADTIVVAAPPVTDVIESQSLCAAADMSLMVVSSRATRAGEVTAALRTLEAARADVVGAVLIEASGGH